MTCYECSRQVFIRNPAHTCPRATYNDDYLCASCELTGGSRELDSEAEQLNSEERVEYINSVWRQSVTD